MKTIKIASISFSLILMASLVSGCFRNDTRIGTFKVPLLQSQECLNYLSGKLRGVEGVMDVQADFSTQTVMVTFNGLKVALKNIEFVIAGSGFDVNDTPASASAKASMPVACR